MQMQIRNDRTRRQRLRPRRLASSTDNQRINWTSVCSVSTSLGLVRNAAITKFEGSSAKTMGADAWKSHAVHAPPPHLLHVFLRFSSNRMLRVHHSRLVYRVPIAVILLFHLSVNLAARAKPRHVARCLPFGIPLYSGRKPFHFSAGKLGHLFPAVLFTYPKRFAVFRIQ